MDSTEIRKKVNAIKWYHTIDLGNGIITRGENNTPKFLKRLNLPEDFSGLTVLDIGAWDGSYSFEAERRGAKRVLATDWFCWGGPGWGTKDGFDLAKEVFNSCIEDKEIDIFDITPGTVGQFDLVLFLGIIYHMRHPLLALEHAASVTKKLLIVETVIDLLFITRPALAFYPEDECGKDATNWYAPNPAAVEAMLRTLGFKRVEKIYPRGFVYLWCIAKAVVKKCLLQIPSTRMVFYAWK